MPYHTSTYEILITATNLHFILSNNGTNGGTRVPHICFKNDYGNTNFPTVTAGNDYWSSHYTGFTPEVSAPLTNCTNAKNCISAAFHHYKSTIAAATKWVTPDYGDLFINELVPIAAHGYNCNYDTITGDRCVDTYHVWWITDSQLNCGAARSLRWKNGPSGEYSWSPGAIGPQYYNNSCPVASGYFDEYYAIYNKDSR